MRHIVTPPAPSKLKPAFLLCLFIPALVFLAWADFEALQSVRHAGIPAPGTTLGLASDLSGAEWKLTWDPTSAPLAHAAVAELSIEDGNHENQILLSPAQIRSGSILYAPFTGDVCFRLSASDGGHRSASEILRALDPHSFETAGDSAVGYSERRFLRNAPGTVIVRATTLRTAPAASAGAPAQRTGWLARLWRPGSKLEGTETAH